jgi:hypothetical protein
MKKGGGIGPAKPWQPLRFDSRIEKGAKSSLSNLPSRDKFVIVILHSSSYKNI